MRVRDADGAIVSVQSSIKVTAAQLQSDPAHPHKKALFVGGSEGSDEIRLRKIKESGRYEVRINGKPQGVHRPSGSLFIYGQGGDDVVQLGAAVSIPAVIFGGRGDDRLGGGSGANVLSGGEGDDVLVGGAARDLLIGGLGADRVDGGSGQDILIAGDAGSSGSLWDLIGIMATWSRSNAAVSLRVNELRQSLLGDEYLADDGRANDVLRGAGGRDWALLDGEFVPHATRPEPGEIVTAA
jgi:Ca2+-binding RTX toxin-like protein